MPEIEHKGSYSLLYKFARKLVWLFIIVCVLALAYTYWRAEISYSGKWNHYYMKFYLASIIGILFWGSILKVKDRIRLNLVIITINLLVGAYIVEAFLHFTTFSSGLKKPAQIAAENGIPYDTRGKLEVINDLRDEGVDAVAAFWPYKSIKYSEASRKSDEAVFPVGGISNITTVLCNESGEYAIYRSDRYGFNNPDSVWDNHQIEWLLTGDSLIHGNCVKPDENIAAQIRQQSGDSAISLGSGGNGMLIELAALMEYAEAKKPKRVIWAYCDCNDIFELNNELKSPLLKKYLKENFSQDLLNRQPEIDLYLNKYMLQLVEEDAALDKVLVSDAEEHYFTQFLRFYHLRQQIGFNLISTNALGVPINLDSLFAEILTKAKNHVATWEGEFYFVYIPLLDDYQDQERRQRVVDLVKSLGIPVIDIYQEVLASHSDPPKLFPFRQELHYTAEGYRLVSQAIIEAVEKTQ